MTQHSDVERITEVPLTPHRSDRAHKGDFGRVTVIAGSRGMSGAARLAGTAALRGGTGLVVVACPERIADIVAAYEPSYLTASLADDDQGKISSGSLQHLAGLLENQDAVAIGPGLGQSNGLMDLVADLYQTAKIPMVVDADALNLLSRRPYLFKRPADGAPRILTPHPGEFARMTGIDVAQIEANRESVAIDFARNNNVVLVLKGAGTIITDGHKLAINETGNSGLATGGTGDVLTGIIVALLGQKLMPFDAAQLGTHLHGLAGDLAAEEHSKPGLIASDLLLKIGRAWCDLGL